jgi:CBS domain-containing protein
MLSASHHPPWVHSGNAADLMSLGVTPISHDATFAEAVKLLVDQNLNVVPVTGEFGEPVGVLSVTDLLIHVRESLAADRVAPATVDTLMTPSIFTISADTPVDEIARDIVQSRVHHLFVTQADGTIMGVVHACDLLRLIA